MRQKSNQCLWVLCHSWSEVGLFWPEIRQSSIELCAHFAASRGRKQSNWTEIIKLFSFCLLQVPLGQLRTSASSFPITESVHYVTLRQLARKWTVAVGRLEKGRCVPLDPHISVCNQVESLPLKLLMSIKADKFVFNVKVIWLTSGLSAYAPVTTPISRNGQVRKQEMNENCGGNGNNVCLCNLFGTLQLRWSRWELSFVCLCRESKLVLSVMRITVQWNSWFYLIFWAKSNFFFCFMNCVTFLFLYENPKLLYNRQKRYMGITDGQTDRHRNLNSILEM
jgi:hypothetical protein